MPIREWQQKYERYLGLIGKNETQKRYARALEKFLGKHPGKTFGHQFLRPVINSYVEARLAEGASVATVRLELSAVRGLFQFALDMGASDVLFNPAKNVRVRQPKSGSQETDRNQATESPVSSLAATAASAATLDRRPMKLQPEVRYKPTLLAA